MSVWCCTTTSTWRALLNFYGKRWLQYPFRVVKPLNGNGIELSYNLLIEAILVSDKKRPAIF
jgi:transposase